MAFVPGLAGVFFLVTAFLGDAAFFFAIVCPPVE
jgi:hypothetical protein